MLNQVVELKREVTAVQIPSGDVLTLPEGERVYITQILGGSYTVATDHGLARISRENADALGAEAAEAPRRRLNWMKTPRLKNGYGIR